VRLVGGGARSPLWRQTVADAFGARVACPLEPESAALGAALQAAAVDAGGRRRLRHAGPRVAPTTSTARPPIGAADLGAWIAERHDAPTSAAIEPNAEDAARLDRAFALYLERAEALFGQR